VKSKAGANRTDFRGNQMKSISAFAAALLLAGCISMGTNYDVAAVDRLQVGMTKAQVIGLLGQPNQVVTNADGSERLVWVHSTGSMFGANARSVGLPFGPDGRLTDVPRQSPQEVRYESHDIDLRCFMRRVQQRLIADRRRNRLYSP